MEALPNEVLLHIFNSVASPAALLTCRLVSRRWCALSDASLACRPHDFWRAACLQELGPFVCDSMLVDAAFDAFFPAFVRPSVDALCRLEDERLWRALFASHRRLLLCRAAPLSRLVLPAAARVSEAVLHGDFLVAVAARPELSVGCLLLAAMPRGAAPKLALKPSVFHSAPGVFHGLAVMSGFPVPGCPELVGPQLLQCPLCGADTASLLPASAAHVTVQVVHKYRGLELIGVCLPRRKALPEETWWRQSVRPREGSCCLIASLHKGVTQVVFRRKDSSYRHLYHLRAGCEGCASHEVRILTAGAVVAAATTECCSAELFQRFDGDRSHRLQASAVWGAARGAGAVADDLRGGGSAAISASALLLQEPTCLVAFSRVLPGPTGLDSWTHCVTERDLSRPEQPRAASVQLGALSPRRVVQLAAKGPVTVLGTDVGKVVALRSAPEGLAAAIARHHRGEDDALVLGTAATNGAAVSGLHMSLQPGRLRVAICTLGNVVFLLQL